MLTVSVLGLGLIGGSLLRALAAAGHRVRGYDAAPQVRTAAAAGSNAWRIAGTVADAVRDADVAVLAVPLPALDGVLGELSRVRWPGILTDVTSVKAPVQRLVYDTLPAARYVGGHPMAGKETSGFTASDPDLFTGCAWALTLDGAGAESTDAGPPTGAGLSTDAGPSTDVGLSTGAEPSGAMRDWLTVAELVTGLGARVVPVTAAAHDTAVAQVSHLSHLTASALAAGTDNGLAGTLAAGSYRDSTRVAASRPPLVAAMCGGNAEALRTRLDDLIERLTDARRRLDDRDPIASLTDWFTTGHRVRAGWPPRHGSAVQLPVSAPALLRLGRNGGWLTGVSPDRRTVTAVRPDVR